MLRERKEMIEDIEQNRMFYENFLNLAQLLMRGDEERVQNIPLQFRGDTPQYQEYLRKKDQWLMFRNVVNHLQKAKEHIELAFAEMEKEKEVKADDGARKESA